MTTKNQNLNWKIKKLISLGDDYQCPFLFPPFNNNISEAAFDIHKLKETNFFQSFLANILSLDIPYEYAKHKDHIFLVMKLNNEL